MARFDRYYTRFLCFVLIAGIPTLLIKGVDALKVNNDAHAYLWFAALTACIVLLGIFLTLNLVDYFARVVKDPDYTPLKKSSIKKDHGHGGFMSC